MSTTSTTTVHADTANIRREALEAATRARAARNLHPSHYLPLAIRVLVENVTQLATESPVVTVKWVEPRHELATKRLKYSAGIAYFKQRTIIVPAIGSLDDALTAVHEIAHVRLGPGGRQLEREIAAWRWTMARAAWWDAECRDLIRPCLETYLNSARGAFDALDLYDTDELLADETVARHYRSRADALDTFERREFARQHGPRDCASGVTCARRASAQRLVNGLACCRECATFAELDIQMAAMKADRMKARRA